MARTSAVPGPQSRIARSISLHRLTQAQVQACRWYLMFRVGGRAQRRQRRTCKHQAGCTMAPDVLLLVSTPLTTDCHTNLMSAPLGSIRHGQLRSCPAPRCEASHAAWHPSGGGAPRRPLFALPLLPNRYHSSCNRPQASSDPPPPKSQNVSDGEREFARDQKPATGPA